ncbi:hypothetical protein ABIB81_009318 [Bradyrhizobium sp. I1.7.5]
MSIRDAGQPIIVVTFPLHGLLAVDGWSIEPPSIDVAAGVAWVVQDAYCRRCSQWPKTVVWLLSRREGNRSASLRKALTVWHAETTRENVSKKWAIVSVTCVSGSSVTLPSWSRARRSVAPDRLDRALRRYRRTGQMFTCTEGKSPRCGAHKQSAPLPSCARVVIAGMVIRIAGQVHSEEKACSPAAENA